MKKILVACGGAVATSTIAADVQQCRIPELSSNAQGTDLIVTTAKVSQDYGVPVVYGIAFVSGINVETTEAKILEILNVN